MRTTLAVLAFLVIFSATAFGQTATPSDRLAFDQPAADFAQVQTYESQLELDGAVLPVQPMSCTDAPTAAGYPCATALPAATPGAHTLRLRTVETVNGVALSSAWTAPFAFTMRAIPAAPTGLRIEPTPAP